MCLSLRLPSSAFELSNIECLLKNKTSYFIKTRKILLLSTSKSKYYERISERQSETKYCSKEKNSNKSKIKIKYLYKNLNTQQSILKRARVHQ